MTSKHILAKKVCKWLSVVIVSLAAVAVASLLAFGQTGDGGGKIQEPGKARSPSKRKAEAKPLQTQPSGSPSNLVTNIPPFDAHGADYLLLAWSDSGMRMVSDCDEFFSLGAPFANLRAQLVKRGAEPALVRDGVTLAYAVESMAQPAGKSAYWRFSPSLAGAQLPNGLGLGGVGQRGSLTDSDKYFVADGIPLVPYAADGSFMPYPTVVVEAREGSSGKLLAMTRAVLPVTNQLGCAKCHGGDEGRPGISAKTAGSILAAHDRLSGGKLLAEAKAGHPRACAECHGEGKKAMSVSASLHGFHAAKLPGMGAESCGYCHPSDKPTAFYRGVHHQRGVDCARCHGSLEEHAAGLLKAERQGAKQQAADRLMAKLKTGSDTPARKAWAQQPSCGGCHDFVTRPKPDAKAMAKWNQGGEEVYRNRLDQTMGLACAACHGPAHAIYPAHNPHGRDRDNIQPMQYMGWAKTIGGAGHCGACHTGKVDAQAPAHHPLPKPVGSLVKLPAEVKPRMPAVRFPHQSHAGVNCLICHHKGYVDGQNLTCSASACHDRTAGDEDPRHFRNAFHGKDFSCFQCHEQKRKAGQASGPVECGGCHNVAR